jgi:uncharacterized paraquat-inducible protein A
MTDIAARMSQADAYRAGICIECQVVRHSAGRPRCNSCHANREPNR